MGIGAETRSSVISTERRCSKGAFQPQLFYDSKALQSALAFVQSCQKRVLAEQPGVVITEMGEVNQHQGIIPEQC